eukprot:5604255-Amphidinium_carterae.1
MVAFTALAGVPYSRRHVLQGSLKTSASPERLPSFRPFIENLNGQLVVLRERKTSMQKKSAAFGFCLSKNAQSV